MNNTFNGHIPVLVYKYILAKVKIKYKQLKRESEKYENKIDDFVNFVSEKLKKITKIILTKIYI